jgi:hypothetical protein
MLDLSSYGCILLIIQLATVRALSLSLAITMISGLWLTAIIIAGECPRE